MCSSSTFVRIVGITAAIALLVATAANAQVTNGVTPVPLPAAQPASQVSPEQMRDIMYLRALQSRSNGGGGRGVRTGVPQFVPFGNLGYGNFGMFPMQAQQSQGATLQSTDPATTRKNSAQKRAELRAKREEEKRALREEAKLKREAAAKAKADANAKGKAGAATP